MSNSSQKQSILFRGIYEFEDPSGCLIAAKVPAHGTIDLYKGTQIIVKPNQCALFMYKGRFTDMFLAGNHEVNTENVPVLSQLANWRFGFKNPLRAEIWFFSGNIFTGRRWGTQAPILANFNSVGTVPIRAFGNYNVVTKNPDKLYRKLIGSRVSYSITDLEDFLQGQIIELLPEAVTIETNLQNLSTRHNDISEKLEQLLNKELEEYGIEIQKIQILSLIPTEEIMEAMNESVAMKLIGNKREYMMYKAANSLDIAQDGGSNDSMQMMMGLMLGKGLMGMDYHEREGKPVGSIGGGTEKKAKFCTDCGESLSARSKFCSNCGAKQSGGNEESAA